MKLTGWHIFDGRPIVTLPLESLEGQALASAGWKLAPLIKEEAMKILIDLWLDGYESKEDMREACIDFVKEQLNMTASGIKILWAEDIRDIQW